jgi:hypothetical protein
MWAGLVYEQRTYQKALMRLETVASVMLGNNVW